MQQQFIRVTETNKELDKRTKNTTLSMLESQNQPRKSSGFLLDELCEVVTDGSKRLKITQEEARAVLESFIDKDVLSERIKKTQLSRKEYTLKANMCYRRYYEVVAHNGIIDRICFDNSSRYAFTGGADGIIKCWDVVEGMLIRSIYGHANMISDLCINKNGQFMVSVDYQGLMNIWNLRDFTLLHSIQFSSEAIFCEFIYPPGESTKTRIFLIFSDGTVNLVEFSLQEITAKATNNFMSGESIKAICITDGGRFVICGGWWPFFLIYDTEDLNKIIVAENFRIQNICAAKNALKFAASSDNRIHIYTFYVEGSLNVGNYKKGKNQGVWRKTMNEIDHEYFVECISFLSSYLLVATCTDSSIRVYEDDTLLVSCTGESGVIYSHPTKNIFVVVGTKLSIYQLITKEQYSEFQDPFANGDYCYNNIAVEGNGFSISNEHPGNMYIKRIFTEELYINLNDCQFSDDGRFFISCDDQGVVKVYSVEKPISVPEGQFFIKDIDTTAEENFTETYDVHRQLNVNWRKLEYHQSAEEISQKCAEIENIAAKTLEKDKLTEEKFRTMYLSGDTLDVSESMPNERNFPMAVGSDRDATYILSDDESGSESTGPMVVHKKRGAQKSKGSPTSSTSSSERRKKKKTPKLRGFKNCKKRRRIIDSEEEEQVKTPNMRRRLISSDTEESSVVVSREKLRTPEAQQRAPRESKRSNEQISLPNKSEFSGGRLLRKHLQDFSMHESCEDEDVHVQRPVRKSSVINKLDTVNRESAEESNEIANESSVTVDSNTTEEEEEEETSTQTESLENENVFDENNKRKTSDSTELFNHSHGSDTSRTHSPSKVLLRSHIKQEKMQPNEPNANKQSFSAGHIVLRRDIQPKRKSSLGNSEEEGVPRGIEKSFELQLAAFSYQWLSSCSLYPSCQVYFNLDAYLQFVGLEPRISFSKSHPKHSGVFTVQSLTVEYVGKIPFLSVSFENKQKISFYEYPESTGILCTFDQFNVQLNTEIMYFNGSTVMTGLVTDVDTMTVSINTLVLMRSFVLFRYAHLDVPLVPYQPDLRPLFNKTRYDKHINKPITNFELINTKLEKNCYASVAQLLFDFSILRKFANQISGEMRKSLNFVITEYEDMLTEHRDRE